MEIIWFKSKDTISPDYFHNVQPGKKPLRTTSLTIPLVVLLSFSVALVSLRFIPLGLTLAFPDMLHQITNAKILFWFHVAASPVALALGSYQLLPNMRIKHMSIHRWVGRTYAVSVLIGGIAGFLIAFQIENTVGAIGFALLAIIWLAITVQAVRFARDGKIAEHRNWMICSFALTFAAVTLRIQLAIFMVGYEMPYSEVHPILAWSCWVPNLLFAYWWVSKRTSIL